MHSAVIFFCASSLCRCCNSISSTNGWLSYERTFSVPSEDPTGLLVDFRYILGLTTQFKDFECYQNRAFYLSAGIALNFEQEVKAILWNMDRRFLALWR